jgi:Uma2 family endonuclease
VTRASVPPGVPRRHFTVDEYYCMAKAGVLREDERVELLDGEVIQMSPIGGRHAGCVDELGERFIIRLAGRARVRIQNPIRLSSGSEPEPDIAVVRPRSDRYRQGHPAPEDVLLVIEVSDTTLDYDRDTKLPFYAAAGIPEVWIWDLNGARVLVFREPIDGQYRQSSVIEHGGVLSPVAFPDLELLVDDFLG